MNSHESNAVPTVNHEADELRLQSPVGDWLRRVWACNPFYLLSAGLLLFGLYRMTVDPMFDARALARLSFTFGSLQFYELTLVAVAVFLARRAIAYDAALLVSLEHLFLMVPFILLTAAGFENQTALWTFTLGGTLLAIGRLVGVRRWVTGLDVSARLLGLGGLFVLVNAAVPFLFKHLDDASVAGRGGLMHLQVVAWFGLLPAMVATINLMPCRRSDSGHATQWPWLPLLWMGMWSVATGSHFWCIRYVFDLPWTVDMVAPALWVAAWTLHNRVSDIWDVPNVVVRRLVLVLPAVVAVAVALMRVNEVYLVLTALNIAAYIVLWNRDRSDQWVTHLVLISVAGLVAGLPCAPRHHMFMAGWGVYFLVATMMLRTPWAAFVGGGVVVVATCGIMAPLPDDVSMGLQCGLVFVLVHSLRWDQAMFHQFDIARWIVAGIWLCHTWGWVGHADKTAWSLVAGLAGVLLVAYGITKLVSHRWASPVIPSASVLAVLSYPVKTAVSGLEQTPSGFPAVLVSFLLLGIGTAVAVWRQHHHEQRGQQS